STGLSPKSRTQIDAALRARGHLPRDDIPSRFGALFPSGMEGIWLWRPLLHSGAAGGEHRARSAGLAARAVGSLHADSGVDQRINGISAQAAAARLAATGSRCSRI